MLFFRKNSLPHGMHKWRAFTYTNYPDVKTGFLGVHFHFGLIVRTLHAVIGLHSGGQELYINMGSMLKEYDDTRGGWARTSFELSYWLDGDGLKLTTERKAKI